MRRYGNKHCLLPTRTREATLSSRVRHFVRRVYKKSARRLNQVAVLESMATTGVEVEADYALYEHQEFEEFRAESERSIMQAIRDERDREDEEWAARRRMQWMLADKAGAAR